MDVPEPDPTFDRLRDEPALLGTFYQAAESRRSAIDQMMWQAPVLSLTAQAFLMTVGLQRETAGTGRMLAGILGFGVALASMQLLSKHRLHEVHLSKWLSHLEQDTAMPNLNSAAERHREPVELPRPAAWLAYGKSSFAWWLLTLAVFGLADVLILSAGFLEVVGVCDPLSG